LLTGVCGWFSPKGTAAIGEAASILAASLFLVTVTSMAEWRKDQEFVQL